MGAFPDRNRAGMLEGNPPAGEVLREAAPGREIQLVGGLELRQVSFQARTL